VAHGELADAVDVGECPSLAEDDAQDGNPPSVWRLMILRSFAAGVGVFHLGRAGRRDQPCHSLVVDLCGNAGGRMVSTGPPSCAIAHYENE
jgi:hypothetical protein